jgi:hypothetical protein
MPIDGRAAPTASGEKFAVVSMNEVNYWFGMRMGLASCIGACVLAGTGITVLADAKPNPYESISKRNVFGLKDPPPNEPPPPPPAPIVPPAIVRMTGITTILNKKKVLLEINDPTGKQPKKPIMEEGDRVDTVEVISIDADHNTVKVKISGLETNLVFEKIDVASKSPATPPGVPPGLPVPRTIPGYVPPGMANPAPTPTLINPSASTSSGSGKSAIVVMGGNESVASPSGASPYAGGYNPGISVGGATPNHAPTANALGTPGYTPTPGVPVRPIRTDTPAQNSPTGRPMTREEASLLIEANAELNRQRERVSGRPFPPLPPTPYSHLVDEPDPRRVPNLQVPGTVPQQ